MKNAVTLFALLVLSIVAASCGGGGGGSLNSPGGENPGVPSIVQLAPSQNVAQTGANITLSEKSLTATARRCLTSLLLSRTSPLSAY